MITNFELRQILDGIGNSSDIFFINTFMQMGINEKDFNKHSKSLIGFDGIEAPIIGIISLHTAFGEAPRCVVLKVEYTMMVVDSLYNAILG